MKLESADCNTVAMVDFKIMYGDYFLETFQKFEHCACRVSDKWGPTRNLWTRKLTSFPANWRWTFSTTVKASLRNPTPASSPMLDTRVITAGTKKLVKVDIVWEGHKILRNLHLTFDWHYIGQKLGEDFAKFCGLLRIYELYQWLQKN